MAKHTAGPWSVEAVGPEEVVITAASGTDGAEDIASMVVRSDIHPNMKANSQLIAAAPDMARALMRGLEFSLPATVPNECDCGFFREHRTCWHTEAIAALKKAGVL